MIAWPEVNLYDPIETDKNLAEIDFENFRNEDLAQALACKEDGPGDSSLEMSIYRSEALFNSMRDSMSSVVDGTSGGNFVHSSLARIPAAADGLQYKTQLLANQDEDTAASPTLTYVCGDSIATSERHRKQQHYMLMFPKRDKTMPVTSGKSVESPRIVSPVSAERQPQLEFLLYSHAKMRLFGQGGFFSRMAERSEDATANVAAVDAWIATTVAHHAPDHLDDSLLTLLPVAVRQRLVAPRPPATCVAMSKVRRAATQRQMPKSVSDNQISRELACPASTAAVEGRFYATVAHSNEDTGCGGAAADEPQTADDSGLGSDTNGKAPSVRRHDRDIDYCATDLSLERAATAIDALSQGQPFVSSGEATAATTTTATASQSSCGSGGEQQQQMWVGEVAYKRELLLALTTAVDAVTALCCSGSNCGSSAGTHFSTATPLTPQIETRIKHIMLASFCPTVHALMVDGLRREVHTTFGRLRPTAWHVVEALVRAPPPPPATATTTLSQASLIASSMTSGGGCSGVAGMASAASSAAIADLVMLLNAQHQQSGNQDGSDKTKLASFMCGLLDMSYLEIWFGSLRWHVETLTRFYDDKAFVCGLHKETRLLFDEFLLCLGRLSVAVSAGGIAGPSHARRPALFSQMAASHVSGLAASRALSSASHASSGSGSRVAIDDMSIGYLPSLEVSSRRASGRVSRQRRDALQAVAVTRGGRSQSQDHVAGGPSVGSVSDRTNRRVGPDIRRLGRCATQASVAVTANGDLAGLHRYVTDASRNYCLPTSSSVPFSSSGRPDRRRITVPRSQDSVTATKRQSSRPESSKIPRPISLPNNRAGSTPVSSGQPAVQSQLSLVAARPLPPRISSSTPHGATVRYEAHVSSVKLRTSAACTTVKKVMPLSPGHDSTQRRVRPEQIDLPSVVAAANARQSLAADDGTVLSTARVDDKASPRVRDTIRLFDAAVAGRNPLTSQPQQHVSSCVRLSRAPLPPQTSKVRTTYI